MIIAPTRAKTSPTAKTSRPQNVMRRAPSSVYGAYSIARDAREQILREFAEQPAHDRHEQEQRQEDRNDLRHEHQGLFLNLRERLQQGHRKAHREPNEHHGRGDDDRQPNGLAAKVQHFHPGHGTPLRLNPEVNATFVKTRLTMRRKAKTALKPSHLGPMDGCGMQLGRLSYPHGYE